MRRINEKELVFLTRARTAIEVDLAKSLYAVFDSEPIIGALRTGVSHVLEELKDQINDDPKAPFASETKNLLVCKKFHIANEGSQKVIANLVAHKHSWTASDCSDLIRLIASVVEPGKNGVKANKGQAAQYMEKQFDVRKPDRIFKNIANATETGRSRTGDMGYKGAPKHIVSGRRQIDIERMIANIEADGERFNRSSYGYGIQRYELTEYSTVRKIDIAFGLPVGADISGTTADSIIVHDGIRKFCCVYREVAGNKSLPEAIVQLLPLATMVAQGHHTLLESALTLTIDGYLNYCIGFYSTIMPKSHDRRGVNELVCGNMMRALRNAETSFGNSHFYCYWNGDKYEGMACDKKEELEEFRKFSWVAPPFREEMGRLSPKINRQELEAAFAKLKNRKLVEKGNVNVV